MAYNPNLYKDQSKRDRTPFWGQVQRWVVKAKTPQEWQESFEKLTIKEQWDILARYTPVPKEIKADSNTTLRLLIEGVNIRPSIDERTVKGLPLPDKVITEGLVDDSEADP